MESPRNTTRVSPAAGTPSFAFASWYLAKLGQSRSCDSIDCRSRFRDSHGSATCCAAAVCCKNTLRKRSKVNFFMPGYLVWIVRCTEKNEQAVTPLRLGIQKDS